MFTPTFRCECAQPGLIDTIWEWSIEFWITDLVSTTSEIYFISLLSIEKAVLTNSKSHVINVFSIHLPLTLQNLTKLSPKHAAHGVAQSTYPIYRHGKACLSKQPPWRAAGDPRLARGRSRVRAPGPAGMLRAFFSSTLPSFLLREIVFFAPSPPTPQKC